MSDNLSLSQRFSDLLSIACVKWGNSNEDATIVMDRAKAAIEELKGLEKLAKKVKPRQPLDHTKPNGYLESDRDWLAANNNEIVDLAERAKEILG